MFVCFAKSGDGISVECEGTKSHGRAYGRHSCKFSVRFVELNECPKINIGNAITIRTHECLITEPIAQSKQSKQSTACHCLIARLNERYCPSEVRAVRGDTRPVLERNGEVTLHVIKFQKIVLNDVGQIPACDNKIVESVEIVNGGAKLVHPGGAKLVHLTLCGTRCWGVVPVVHRRDPRCFV